MCTDSTVLSVVNFILRGFDILMILVPALLIVMGSIDFFKIVTSNEGNKESKHVMAFVKRCIFAALLFFAPLIVKTCLIMVGDSSYETTFSDCIKNSSNIAYYKELEETNRAKEETNDPEEEKKLAKTETVTLKNNVYDNDEYKDEESDEPEYTEPELTPEPEPTPGPESEVNPSPVKPGIQVADKQIVGDNAYRKYNLTEKQLEDLAKVCKCEQSDGVTLEASLIANLFEYRNTKKKGDANALYNYVINGKWFSCATGGEYKSQTLTNKDIQDVKNVLVLGKRNLPLYVIEHDCIYCNTKYVDVNGDGKKEKKALTDIAKIIYKGKYVITSTDVKGVASNWVSNKKILDTSLYIKDKTIVYNVYVKEESDRYTVHLIHKNGDQTEVFGYPDYTKWLYNQINGK